MIAMPNFESNVDMLGGPTGYACTITNTAPFTRDLFLDVPLGMGLSMYKVKSTKGWSYHIPESAEQACVDRLRSELRDKAEYPPKLRSAIPSETAMDISGAWEPSLGVDGFVALLAKLDAKGSTHYVLVRAGLDPATIGEAETLFSEAEMDGKTMREMVPLFHDIQALGSANRDRIAGVFCRCLDLVPVDGMDLFDFSTVQDKPQESMAPSLAPVSDPDEETSEPWWINHSSSIGAPLLSSVLQTATFQVHTHGSLTYIYNGCCP